MFNLYAFCFQVTDDAHPADSRGVVVVTRALEMKLIGNSVTRLGDLLHFGQLFKAFGNNKFAKIAYVFSKFL